jgi:hypothetical protein
MIAGVNNLRKTQQLLQNGHIQMQKLFPRKVCEIRHISGKGFPVGKRFPLGMHPQLGSIFCVHQYGETLPRVIKSRKLFQKAIFWNSVKYSPLDDCEA